MASLKLPMNNDVPWPFCRSLQQQLAMLNSKLASSNLCIEELQAEKATMVSATSLQQLGNAQKSAKAESNAAEHAVSTHLCEAETELEALRAQVSSQSLL